MGILVLFFVLINNTLLYSMHDDKKCLLASGFVQALKVQSLDYIIKHKTKFTFNTLPSDLCDDIHTAEQWISLKEEVQTSQDILTVRPDYIEVTQGYISDVGTHHDTIMAGVLKAKEDYSIEPSIVKVWNSAGKNEKELFSCGQRITTKICSINNAIAGITNKGQDFITLYDMHAGKICDSFGMDPMGIKSCSTVNDSTLAVGSQGNTMKIWDVRKSSNAQQVITTPGPVNNICTYDEQHVVASSYDITKGKSELALYDLSSDNKKRFLIAEDIERLQVLKSFFNKVLFSSLNEVHILQCDYNQLYKKQILKGIQTSALAGFDVFNSLQHFIAGWRREKNRIGISDELIISEASSCKELVKILLPDEKNRILLKHCMVPNNAVAIATNIGLLLLNLNQFPQKIVDSKKTLS